jgi:hypothetical protein
VHRLSAGYLGTARDPEGDAARGVAVDEEAQPR